VCPDGDPFAPDVLDGLGPSDPRVVHQHVDSERAVVRAALTLITLLGKLHGSPRPREDGIRVQVPGDLPRRLDPEALRGGVEEPSALLVSNHIHGLPLVLARPPARRELSDRRRHKVFEHNTVVLGLHRADAGAQPHRDQGHGAPSPETVPRYPPYHRRLLLRPGGREGCPVAGLSVTRCERNGRPVHGPTPPWASSPPMNELSTEPGESQGSTERHPGRHTATRAVYVAA
jgi:hypothetical protein